MTVVAVVGPTASGKSALGIELARLLDGEVVNADSMQLYRGMDIGTAKLRPHERGDVPHHLLDIWPVTEAASVAEYQRLARARVDALLAEGRAAVLVGGSGLYVRAVLDSFEFPGTDPAVRAMLEAEAHELGTAALHERLRAADPAAAEAILPSNSRRIVRALEVIALTGRPFTASLPEFTAHYDAVQIGVDRAPADLDARCDTRVDLMWADGFVEEVRGLLPAGLAEGPTASRALGYAQVLAFLAGDLTEDEARAQTKQTTRRFVRRQRSWFRRDSRIHWLDGSAPDLAAEASALVGASVTGPG